MGSNGSFAFAMVKRAAVIGLLTLASACGVSYISPSVQKEVDGAPVTVVPMTMKSIAAANASTYVPRQLPAAFFAAAGTGGTMYGAGALPSQPYIPTEGRKAMDFRPLPDAARVPYRIGVGDVVLLATRSSGSTIEQLSGLLAAQNSRQGYTVRDDGTIAIPEIGSVALAGLTVKEAEDQLFDVLVRNQIDPSFSLEVAEFNSQRVAVGGAVNAARLVPITLNPVTLGEAITAAGGMAVKDEEFASIRIYRDGTLYQIPVEIFKDRPDLQKKVLLGGDAVFVDTTYDLDRALAFYESQLSVIEMRSAARAQALTMLQTEIEIRRSALNEQRSTFQALEDLGATDRDYVYLSGEVNNQARFALPYGQTASLADVLYGEGGFDTTTGNPREIYVLRGTNAPGKVGQILAYHLNAENAAALIVATRFEMRPNDVVFIEEQPITKWGRALQQVFPTILQAASRGI